MTTRKPKRSAWRRTLPWIIGSLAAQLGMRVGGRLLARRLNFGDETSSAIRRVATFDQVTLTPTAEDLTRLQFDLFFAGLELDLTGARPRPGGIDLTLNCVFAGGNVHLPADWQVSWDRRGPTGVNVKQGEAITQSDDPDVADLRVHVQGLVGGVALIAKPASRPTGSRAA